MDRVRSLRAGGSAEVTLEANPGADDRGDPAGFAPAGGHPDALRRAEPGRRGAPPRSGGATRRRTSADAVAAAREAGIAKSTSTSSTTCPARASTSWEADARRLRTRPRARLRLRADPGRPRRRRAHRAGRGSPADDRRRPRWRERALPAGRGRGPRPATSTRTPPRRGRVAWYEISNWARPSGEPAQPGYWHAGRTRQSARARALDGGRRRWNAARLEGWLTALIPAGGAPPALPPGSAEVLDSATAATEALILGLRTARGIARARAFARADEMAWAHEAGLVEDGPGEHVRLTLRGRLLSNELFARLVWREELAAAAGRSMPGHRRSCGPSSMNT